MPSHTEEERRKRRAEEVAALAAAKDPAQTAAQKAAASDFLRRREKARSRGLSRREATAQAEAGQKGISFKQVKVGEAQRARAAAQKQFFQPAEELRTGLVQKIKEKPSLEPKPIVQEVSRLGLLPAVKAGNLITGLLEGITGKKFGRTTTEELAKTEEGKALGLATLGTAGVLAAVIASPLMAQIAARSAIVTSVTTKTLGLRTLIEGFGIFIVGKGVLDFQGGEMDTMRKTLQKMVEDGERIEAAVRNGFPNSDSLELLQQMAEEVSFAEQRIKELGNFNIKYRVDKKYLEDSAQVRSAREALVRRVLAIENIAATGQASLNPEALLFIAAGFK